MNDFRTVAVFLLAALLAGCHHGNQAIESLADNTRQLSELLPRVADIPFESCVRRWIYAELPKEPRTFPERKGAVGACRPEAENRDRLTKEFSVLSDYLAVLGKLASGQRDRAVNPAKNIAATAASLTGADAGIAGLSGALTNAFLEARTSRILKRAITDADPHVQALCSGFQTRIARIPALALDNQELELRALYSDSLTAAPANRLLLFRQFDAEASVIAQGRELTARYSTLLGQIAKTHATLFANRHKLESREAAAEILENAGLVGQQLDTIRAILK